MGRPKLEKKCSKTQCNDIARCRGMCRRHYNHWYGCEGGKDAPKLIFRNGHGHTKQQQVSAEWKTWQCMKSRCMWKADRSYARYGGRGIAVCKRWLGPKGFIHFIADMGCKPSKAHSIERLNNSQGYSPRNCRWATRIEQANNKRNNRFLKFEGERLTIPEWGRRKGLKVGTIRTRLSLGWTAAQTLSRPAGPIGSNQLTYVRQPELPL